jgi:hypothetical protein
MHDDAIDFFLINHVEKTRTEKGYRDVPSLRPASYIQSLPTKNASRVANVLVAEG